MKLFLTLALLILISFRTYSQSQLNLINGKSVDCFVDSVSETSIYGAWKKRNNSRGRDIIFHRSEVYSITESNGKEDLVFLQDTVTGLGYTLEGIRVYRQGCVDAREKVNTHITKFLGFGLGVGFVLWETNMYKEDAGTINILFPVVYTLAVGVWKPKPRRKGADIDVISNPTYYRAYSKVGQGRRIGAALKGSLTGVLTGLIVSGVINLTEKE